MKSPSETQHPSRRDMLRTMLAAAASVALPSVTSASEQSLSSRRLPGLQNTDSGGHVFSLQAKPLLYSGEEPSAVPSEKKEEEKKEEKPEAAPKAEAPRALTPEELKELVNKRFEDVKTLSELNRALFDAKFNRAIPLPDKKYILESLQHKHPVIVRSAVGVIHARREMKFTFKEILPLVGHSDVLVRALALRGLAIRGDIDLPGNALRKIEKALDPLADQPAIVRRGVLSLLRGRKPGGTTRFLSKHFLAHNQADHNLYGALEFIKTDEHFMKRTRTVDIVRCHQDLKDFELEGGDGLRLGEILLSKCLHGVPAKQREEAAELAMPLLGFLGAVDKRFPGYLDCLGAKERDIKRFCIESLKCILKARHEEVAQSRSHKTTDKVILGLLHDEAAFKTANFEKKLKELAEVSSVTVKKIHQYDTVAEDREMMLFWLGAEDDAEAEQELMGDDPKKKFEYLADLEAIAEDTSKQAIVWNSGHGGPEHFWMSSGNFGDHTSNNLHHPAAISYKEMAMVLVRAQTPRGRMASGTTIDLSHMTLINDACLQFDFVRNLQDEMHKIAGLLGVEIKAFPRMVAAAQKGMPDWIVTRDNHRARGRVYDSGSYLQNEVGQAGNDANTLTPLEKLLRADTSLRKDMERNLSNPWVGRRLYAQDMAVFSSRVRDIDTLVEGIVDRLNKRFNNSMPPLPEEREDIRASERHSLQISQSDEKSRSSYAEVV